VTCTRCKKAPATEGRRRCEPCARYARRWDADHESAPPRVRGIRSESLRPVQLIGDGVVLGLEVVMFEVLP
jgi:hypothetical protein